MSRNKCNGYTGSSEEVEHEEVQHDRAQHKVRERTVDRSRKQRHSITQGESAHRSGDTSLNSARFSGFTCERRDAVRTNWPTLLANLHRIRAPHPCLSILAARTLRGRR
jgi:hypothetical protein